MSEIYIGADLKSANVNLTDAAGNALEWANFDTVELYIQDRYKRNVAQYKYPEEAGFHPLYLDSDGIAVFHLFAADTALLVPGDVYAKVVMTATDAAFVLDYKPEVRNIYLAKAVR